MNKYFLLLLLVGFSIPVAAQLGEQRNNLSIGVNAGANYNNVSFTPSIKQNGYMAYAGGFTARYISEKYFAMICGAQLELNYSQRGWEEKIEDNSNTYSRAMNYLEIPFLAHLAFGKDKGTQFFINMGPQIAFLLNEKENFSTNWDASNRTNGINYQYGKMADNKFDYGIIGGAGLDLNTGVGHFLLEGRYFFGLADFYKNNKANTNNFEKSSNNTVSVRLTYLFDISK
ncbi:porin family protein [uncultured Bacteroides sp.]|uniref:porin family protein n=1 Tax=uncultured Bacteroides sp. TaxID=162156 RepID=UPI002AAC21F2|nr:porin family protein [uncultured Bacteroides sp.]